MNKEIYQEGWLIKSPPTKRIWRARWRRRWFTLKQGEIPGQFCLEYYTDRNCRKLKGVIDLDQCEQVDSGLRLEHRKQKFQFMFDIKTPRRTYYLAADTESDMRDWVNHICQVCNLHDFTKQPGERQYYNLCENDAPVQSASPQTYPLFTNDNISSDTTTTTLNSSIPQTEKALPPSAVTPDVIRGTEEMSISNTYQNNDFQYVNTEYSNRETLNCDAKLPFFTASNDQTAIIPNHARAQSFSEQTSKPTKQATSPSSGGAKKIPENLVLSDTFVDNNVVPSPALSTSSGPYIPISECFSGSPKFLPSNEMPSTPLNSLDPKFYDTPRKHNNIGLNLTNDQSYSPKIYNCPQQQGRPRSGRSSPTDSESVFTDDEDWSHPHPLRESIDRNMRPSDSSVENEAIVFTYTQRFSKIPEDGKTAKGSPNTSVEGPDVKILPKPKNRLILESTSEDEKNRELPQFSDTENSSPAIGPKDASCCVEESYDIPRSHHLPYYNMSHLNNNSVSPTLINSKDVIASSTPNLIAGNDQTPISTSSRTLPRPHFYTNAAPTKIEGNVFRYDFIEQGDAPAVNRSLKPKLSLEEKSNSDAGFKPPVPFSNAHIEKSSPVVPPSIDRTLKPAVFKSQESPKCTNSLRRRTGPASLVLPSDFDFSGMHQNLESRTLPRNIAQSFSGVNTFAAKHNNNNISPFKSHSQLQYFDLDVANPPPPPTQSKRAIYANNATAMGGTLSKLGTSMDSATVRQPAKSGVVYNSVDFLKTEAFKRIREDAEKNRMKNTDDDLKVDNKKLF